MSSRIYWRDDERAAIAKRAAEFMLDRPERTHSAQRKVLNHLPAVMLAQKDVLPLDRQRKSLGTVADMQPLIMLIDSEIELLRQEKAAHRLAELAQIEAEITAANAITIPVPEPEPPAKLPAPPQHKTRPADILAEALAKALTLLLAEALNSKILKEAVIEAFNPPPEAEAPQIVRLVQPKSAPRPVLKRVVIAGLDANQAHEIRAHYGTQAELKFFGPEAPTALLHENAQHADLIFAMVGRLPHRATNALKKALREGAHYSPVNGRLTDLKNVMAGLLNGSAVKP